MKDNGPNLIANPDDAVRREHLGNLLRELGNPDAVWIDGVTPVIDYYLESAKDPDSMVSRLPYNEETGVPKGGVHDMRHGDVIKVQIVGKDFLTVELERYTIPVGFRAIALMREPDVTSAIFTSNDEWIAHWKNS